MDFNTVKIFPFMQLTSAKKGTNCKVQGTIAIRRNAKKMLRNAKKSRL